MQVEYLPIFLTEFPTNGFLDHEKSHIKSMFAAQELTKKIL